MQEMKTISIDTETLGLEWQKSDRPFVVSMTTEEGKNLYWRAEVDPFTRKVTWTEKQKNEIRKITEDKAIRKVFHNAPFDIHMLKSVGINVVGPVVCTIIFTHLCNNGFMSYALKKLGKDLFNISADDETELKQSVRSARRIGKKKGFKLGPVVETDYFLGNPGLCKKYACLDTDRTILLWTWCVEKAKQNPKIWELLEMETKCMHALIAMEEKGIKIDFEEAKKLELYYENVITKGEKEKEVLGYKDLNTKSPKQMMELFYGKLNAKKFYKMGKKDGKKVKKLTANKTALEFWAEEFPIANAIQSMNSAKSELATFVQPLQNLADSNHILHPNYRQCGAITGRLSCSNPNLQNISNVSTSSGGVQKLSRSLFVPREGHVLYFPDYSQVEVWIAAFASGDEVMKEFLLSGNDMHGSLNLQFFGHKEDYAENIGSYRKKIKGLTFATLYGAGGELLSTMGFGLSLQEGQDFIALFFTKYDELNTYKRALMFIVQDIGYIEDPFGRRYYINPKLAYKALNYMIQGSASGVMKRAIINVSNELKKSLGCDLLLTIHDELCIEVPLRYHSKELMRKINSAMQGEVHKIFGMPKPFEVSMAMTHTNWAEKFEVEL